MTDKDFIYYGNTRRIQKHSIGITELSDEDSSLKNTLLICAMKKETTMFWQMNLADNPSNPQLLRNLNDHSIQ
jgi:hypothetical protein